MKQTQKSPFFLRKGVFFLVFILMISMIPPLQAQGDARFFPETGHYLRGSFRTFWETNGGIYLFGYPITEEYVSPGTGNLTQYFERARFEMRVLNGQPYIELGKLGLEITAGRSFPKAQPIQNTAQRRYIPQTQYIIQYGFKQIWETHGAERIFGLPISNELEEVMPDGRMRTVQYFERARFEYWPEYAEGQRVVLSALGRMLAPPERTTPVNQPIPASQPAQQQPEPAAEPQQPVIPDNVNASVSPRSGNRGTDFAFTAEGFEPNEQVSVWLTPPGGGDAIGLDETQATDNGEVNDVKIIKSGDLQPNGVWVVTAQGVDSGNQAFGYFLLGETASGQPTTNFDYNNDGSVTCADFSTCEQAQAALNAGYSSIDGDNDGIPCENLCIWQQTPAAGAGQPVSGIPDPINECANNAPAPVEGVPQAWMQKRSVEANEDEENRLCVRFILNGQVLKGIEARGAVRFEEDPVWIGPEDTREEDGVASIQFDIDNKDADDSVRVDAELIYNGQSFYASTDFKIQD
jgi:hypothetical protein